MKLKQLERSARQAMHQHRKDKLSKGLTFMINSDQLPTGQCYFQHPDGSISLVTLSKSTYDFQVIEEYSTEKSNDIRKKFKLS